MKTALIHDHLTQDGGAERVLRVLSKMHKDAPIFTLAYKPEKFDPPIPGKVITSFLTKFPLKYIKFKWLLPLMPTATEHYKLHNYTLIISSTSSFAKGIIPQPGATHICYCHTPTRYLWTDTHEYIQNLKIPKILKKILPYYLSRLRQWDKLAAERVDFFIANSKTVQERIERFYNRESTIIYPPIETKKFKISNQPKKYYLAGGRIMAYKKFDLIVETFNKLNIPIKIFGDGPFLEELIERANPNIEFLGRVSDEERSELFSNCIAFINPQEEDLGMTPLECMASGRPVIAYGVGGNTETVVEGETGVLFYKQTWQTLADTIIKFDHNTFIPEEIKEYAENFSVERFEDQMRDFTKKALETKKHQK